MNVILYLFRAQIIQKVVLVNLSRYNIILKLNLTKCNKYVVVLRKENQCLCIYYEGRPDRFCGPGQNFFLGDSDIMFPISSSITLIFTRRRHVSLAATVTLI